MASADVYRGAAGDSEVALSARVRRMLFSHGLPAAFFGFFCGLKAMFAAGALVSLERSVSAAQAGYASLRVADQLLGLLYFGLLAFLCATRLPRRAGKRGLGTVAASFFAAFSILFVGVLPDRRPRPEAELLGSVLLAAGMAYSIWALLYLRRSFSILPEARRLVTGGPYGLSRHPLYLGEGVAALGLLIPAAGPIGIVLTLGALGAQLLRMRWEEAVLRRQFPQYTAYARRVPRYLPFIS